MAQTLQDYRDYTRLYFDVDDDDIPDSLIDVWVQEGQALILAQRPHWPHLYEVQTFSTVIGTADYQVGLNDIQGVQAPEYELAFIDALEADSLFLPSAVATGDLRYWSVQSRLTQATVSVRLYPTPSAVTALNVRGWRAPIRANLTTSTSPDLPEAFHTLISTYCLARASAQQMDYGNAEFHQATLRAELESLVAENSRPGSSPIIVNRGRRRVSPPPLARFPFERF